MVENQQDQLLNSILMVQAWAIRDSRMVERAPKRNPANIAERKAKIVLEVRLPEIIQMVIQIFVR